jgi:hypothetical protein
MAQHEKLHSPPPSAWPEGSLSIKFMVNPYLLLFAITRCQELTVELGELINVALWEKLGKPDRDELVRLAAEMEVSEEHPRWMRHLQTTANFELSRQACSMDHDHVGHAHAETDGENGNEHPSVQKEK